MPRNTDTQSQDTTNDGQPLLKKMRRVHQKSFDEFAKSQEKLVVEMHRKVEKEFKRLRESNLKMEKELRDKDTEMGSLKEDNMGLKSELESLRVELKRMKKSLAVLAGEETNTEPTAVVNVAKGQNPSPSPSVKKEKIKPVQAVNVGSDSQNLTGVKRRRSVSSLDIESGVEEAAVTDLTPNPSGTVATAEKRHSSGRSSTKQWSLGDAVPVPSPTKPPVETDLCFPQSAVYFPTDHSRPTAWSRQENLSSFTVILLFDAPKGRRNGCSSTRTIFCRICKKSVSECPSTFPRIGDERLRHEINNHCATHPGAVKMIFRMNEVERHALRNKLAKGEAAAGFELRSSRSPVAYNLANNRTEYYPSD